MLLKDADLDQKLPCFFRGVVLLPEIGRRDLIVTDNLFNGWSHTCIIDIKVRYVHRYLLDEKSALRVSFRAAALSIQFNK